MVEQTEETTIRQMLERWAAAVQAENLEAVVEHHASDIVMFDVPPPFQLTGIDAYKSSWQNMFEWFQGTGVFEIHDLFVITGNDVAFAYGTIRCRGSEILAEPYLSIRLTVGLQKQSGSWVVTHEHHSEPARPS